MKNIEFKNTKDIISVSFKNNVIYYMYDYYKKWWIDKYPNITHYRDNYNAFMALKNCNYSFRHRIKFPAAIKNFLSLFDNSWIICTVPGHEKSSNESNGVTNVIDMVYSNFQLQKCYSLIQRKYEVEKKSVTKNRNTNLDEEIKSLKINSKYNIDGKNIIIFDDITTTGTSLLACKKLLLDSGASKVVVIALGKTKEPEYGWK